MNPEIQIIVDRREESQRRSRLMKLIELIENGEFDASKIPLDSLYSTHDKPRQEYISPEDRNTYNYGYMEVGEMMASSPNVK